MRAVSRPLPCVLFFLVHLPACGASSHVLESVTPATADAGNFPNGQVQFTAIGLYSTESLTAQLQVVVPSLEHAVERHHTLGSLEVLRHRWTMTSGTASGV